MLKKPQLTKVKKNTNDPYGLAVFFHLLVDTSKLLVIVIRYIEY